MRKSHGPNRRRARLVSLVALALFLIPAPVMGGVEWTLQARAVEPGQPGQPVEPPAPAGERSIGQWSIDDVVNAPDAVRQAPDRDAVEAEPAGSEAQPLMGVEWT
jgi:hypothetical protein